MRRISALLMVLLLTFFNLSALKVFAYAQGDGTEGNPYIIETPQDLQDMNEDLEAYYVLGNDLDMSDFEWTPIGSYGDPFVGQLDGAGYEITNLELVLSQSYIFEEVVWAAGMFGAIESEAVIMNLGLQYILDELDFDTDDQSVMIGGLATYIEGYYDININNIWVDGFINFSTTSSSRYTSVGGIFGEGYLINDLSTLSFTGDIFVDAEKSELAVGGIVGWAEDLSIIDSRVYDATIKTGKVKNQDSAVGGILGALWIGEDYFYEDYVLFRNIVKNTVVEGGNNVHAGGMAGMMYDDYDDDFGVARNYLSDVDVIGGRSVGGFVGNSYYMEYFRNELNEVTVKACDTCFDMHDPDFNASYGYYGIGGFVGFSLEDQIVQLVMVNTEVNSSVEYSLRAGGVAGGAEDSLFVYIDATVQVATLGNAGGVVGYSDDNYFQGVFVTGSVEGFTEVGGIIGSSNYDNYMEFVSFTGSLKGTYYVGGLVGFAFSRELEINYATVRAEIVDGDYLGGILGFSNGPVLIGNVYFVGTLESAAEYEAKVDPITNSTEDLLLNHVFYDNEVYTDGSIHDGTGYATEQFKDEDSEVASLLGVDGDFSYNNEFFVSPNYNDGYFALYGERSIVVFISENEVVGAQLTYGRITLFEDEEYANPNVNEYVGWGRLVQPWEITRDGYVFEGWSEDEEGAEMIDLADFEYEFNVIYAQWSEELPDTGEVASLGFFWMSLGVLGLLISRKRKA